MKPAYISWSLIGLLFGLTMTMLVFLSEVDLSIQREINHTIYRFAMTDAHLNQELIKIRYSAKKNNMDIEIHIAEINSLFQTLQNKGLTISTENVEFGNSIWKLGMTLTEKINLIHVFTETATSNLDPGILLTQMLNHSVKHNLDRVYQESNHHFAKLVADASRYRFLLFLGSIVLLGLVLFALFLLRSMTLQQNRLNMAVESSADAIFITNTEGVIEYVNPSFCLISGWSNAEAIGKTPRILKSGLTDRQVYKDLWQTITSGKQWHGVFQNKRKTKQKSVSASESKSESDERELYWCQTPCVRIVVR